MKSLSLLSTRRRFLQDTALTTLAAIPVASGLGAIQADGASERIKIGQIGTQHAHASGKMQSLRKLRDLYEVVGVVEPDSEAREKAERSATFKDIPFLTEEALLNTPGLQVVAVETPVRDLVKTAIRCLEADFHIHLDKPAGASMSACRELHAVAVRQNRTIQMGYMFRYNAGFEFLFDILKKGWLGEITEVSGMIGKLGSNQLRDELIEFPGGGMFELGCHLIDAVVTVLGKPDAVQSIVRRTKPERDQFADNQLAVFEYSKAIGTIRCNHLDPFGSPRRQFNVTGDQGTIEIRPLEVPRARIALDRDRGSFRKGFQDVRLARMTGRYDGSFRDLAKVIRGEKTLAWDAEHDLAVHETVLRASGMSVD
ncbi:Gfo/Idh/MocA family oxidoreductase [bacterium]|nr:Gfo/Idh/MocA family oxidoreductase [bacterium]MDB4798129.1 Gfo/Idh/MocA family oxidoreductase [Verrucomicrobiota bacterium]